MWNFLQFFNLFIVYSRSSVLLSDMVFSRIAGEEGGKDSTCSEYETLVTWVDQAQALMDAPVNVTDEASLSAHSTMVQVIVT